MLKPAGNPDLAPESLGADGGAELGVEHLEGDGLAGLVAGGVDGGHGAASELALERVGAGEGGLEMLEEVRFHGNETVTA